MSRVVLLDRDGVLCADRPDFVKSVDELDVLPGVPEALGRLTAARVRLAVVSNQSCIGRGIVDRASVDEINATLARRLSTHGGRLDGFFICPHAPDAGCACRKPKPGLVEAALAALDAKPSEAWLLGDDLRDLAAAKAAHCRGALLLTGKGRGKLDQARNVPKFLDVADFSGWFIDEVQCGRA